MDRHYTISFDHTDVVLDIVVRADRSVSARATDTGFCADWTRGQRTGTAGAARAIAKARTTQGWHVARTTYAPLAPAPDFLTQTVTDAWTH